VIKNLNRCEFFRLSLLSTTAISVFLVLLKSLISPSYTTKVADLDFPESISLKEWQQLNTSFINNKNNNYPEEISAKHYRYIRNNLPLDIEMRYLASSDGNVQKIFKRYNHLGAAQLSTIVRQQPSIGFYGLLTHQNKASLTACINPQRNSTFKAEQFVQNQMNLNVLSNRFLPWLLAGESLRDRRCLWVNLSITLTDSSQQKAYLTLEKAWVDWYQYWHPRLSS
jgi:cyanosortase A-associated protein